jgi:hypothetical protein
VRKICGFSSFAFFNILFVSSNIARCIPEFPILFVLHGSRTVRLFRETYHFQFERGCINILLLSHLETLTQVHTRIDKNQLKYLRYITVQSCSQLPKEQQPLIFKDKQQ